MLSETTSHQGDCALVPIRAPQSVYLLTVAAEHEGIKLVELHGQRELVLGRASSADICVDDSRLSRQHARFAAEDGGVRVRDLKSRNGTWVRGTRVDEALLRPGEAVVLAGVTVYIQRAPDVGAGAFDSAAGFAARVHDEWLRTQVLGGTFSVLCLISNRPYPELASLLLGELRPIDEMVPRDAHSLLVLLPELGAEGARRVAERLTRVVRDKLGLRCGLASYPESASTPELLMECGWQAAQRATRTRPIVSAKPRAIDPAQPVRRSAASLELQRMVERVASRPITVLVAGETGTGKELVAHELHARSPRRNGPFKAVNCAAIPAALVESILFGHVKGAFTGADRDRPGALVEADGGTIFLDEVGELSREAQAALLRVLETRSVCPVGGGRELTIDVRVVAATHRDLEAMSAEGSFRLDLYHRLNSVVLELAPLRARRDEIEPLVEYFLQRLALQWGGAVPTVSAQALHILRAYAWPGNVRELRNVLERAVALCEGDTILPQDLPAALRGSAERSTLEAPALGEVSFDLRSQVELHEAHLIREALRQSEGNQRRAAALLNIPLRTFERKLKSLRAQD